MATFTTLAKIYSIKYFCNTKVSGLGEIFVKRKFSCILYNKTHYTVAKLLLGGVYMYPHATTK